MQRGSIKATGITPALRALIIMASFAYFSVTLIIIRTSSYTNHTSSAKVYVKHFIQSKDEIASELTSAQTDFESPQLKLWSSSMPNKSKKDEIHESQPELSFSSPDSPYAYVWIFGAVHEDRPSYKGFLWDILISVNLLRKFGSTADYCLLVRLDPESKLDSMPDEDMRLLNTLGVKVKLLDKPKKESFSRLMYDKFLSLKMSEYKRVIFLDADIVPLMNMDYYFYLSDPDYESLPTVLRPNFIVATKGEPCNGGFFMIQPSDRNFDLYADAVSAQREKAKDLPYPYFDKQEGWGHNFRKNNDRWESYQQIGFGWHFHGAHVDQGLLYYLVKYIYKDVSIAIGDKIQNWKAVDGQELPELDTENVGELQMFLPNITTYQYSCNRYASNSTREDELQYRWKCQPPYEDYAHFTGKTKPWQGKIDINDVNNTYSYRQKAVKNLWFKELVELNGEYDMGLDLNQWNEKYLETMRQSSLGYMPNYSDQKDILEGDEGLTLSKE